ncbi:MAG: prepilin-type N-terminal cleavage/methylation domain-containing protein [Rhodocyclaceae bacterium]|nr:prepilin-type N-terminal cleavage/methylation domain-containing protein [Rhodocyclaceae bacterium]MBX3667418.1 prepilin-type N-terminal cleavage/methylation domain-containing protein [Rhodocyclaceae bacterium]
MSQPTHARGFTLIELMITVAVVAILAAIAIPNYSEYIKRARRSSAQQYLSDLAQQQEQYLTNARAYAICVGTTCSDSSAGVGSAAGSDVSTYYGSATVYADNTAGQRPRYTMTIAPITTGPMNGDGMLVVNSNGQRWRDTGNACATATCSRPSGAYDWK